MDIVHSGYTFAAQYAAAQTSSYNGLNLNMGNLSRLSHAKTRSIGPENLTGEKGKGGMATEGTSMIGTCEFTTPYSGLAQVIRPDGHYDSQQRFGLYRWHIMDPIRFEKDLKVTIQALGWRSGWRHLPLQDDISSVAYWYQTEPHAPFPKLPDKDYLEIE